MTNSSTKRAPAFARWEWFALAGILLVGLILRALYLRELVQQPDFTHPFLDPQFYDYWARAILTGDWTPIPGADDPMIPTTPFVRPPGYPYFLALAYLLTGKSYLGARLIQMGMGLANVALMFFLGRAVFGRVVGLLAAAFMSVYWTFIFFEGELNSPVVIVFLMLCIMLGLQLWTRRIGVVRAAIPGVLLGLLVLIRPEAILFVAVVAAWGAWATRGQTSWWRRGVALGAFVCGVAVAIAPVTIRNYRVGHEFVLISTGGGVNLYGANNALADGTWPMVYFKDSLGLSLPMDNNAMPRAMEAFRRQMGDNTLTHSDFSRYFTKLSVDYMKSHPWRTAKLIMKKAVLFWGPNEIGNNKELYFYKLDSPVLRYMPGFPTACALFLLGLAILGLDARATWRERRGWPSYVPMVLLFLSYIATQFFSVLPFIVPARYRVGVTPYLLLFGAYAVCRVGAWARQGDLRKAGYSILAGVGLFGLCHIEFVPYHHNPGRWHYYRGWAYSVEGDRARAEEEYRLAVATPPVFAQYYCALGDLAVDEGRRDEALKWYQQAVKADANSPEAQNSLGYELYLLGRPDQAVDYFRRAIAGDYQFGLARNNLGNALADLGRYDEAVAEYAAALDVNPRDRYADYNWGRVLAKQGRSEEAVARFRESVRKNPDYAEAHNELAYELAKLGHTDEAIQEYEAAIKADPSLAPAYHNLGNLLTDLGKYDQAADCFKRLIEADPKDPYADYNWGRALALQGRTADAVARFRESVRKNPGDPDAHNYLGYELSLLGQLQPAIDEFEEALRLNPALALAHVNLGNTLAAAGRFDEALKHLYAAKRMRPNDRSIDDRITETVRATKQGTAAPVKIR